MVTVYLKKDLISNQCPLRTELAANIVWSLSFLVKCTEFSLIGIGSNTGFFLLLLDKIRVIKQHLTVHYVLTLTTFGLWYGVTSTVDTEVSKDFAASILKINILFSSRRSDCGYIPCTLPVKWLHPHSTPFKPDAGARPLLRNVGIYRLDYTFITRRLQKIISTKNSFSERVMRV